MNVEPDREPRLGPWLLQAAVGIAVWPADPNDALSTWGVEVNNGLGGHAGAGTMIAQCPTELEAELIACALWRFVNQPLLLAAAAESPSAVEHPSITCPECGMTSYNTNDISTGYCGNCHKFTTPR